MNRSKKATLLATARLASGMYQKELAERLGVSTAYLGKVERGEMHSRRINIEAQKVLGRPTN